MTGSAPRVRQRAGTAVSAAWGAACAVLVASVVATWVVAGDGPRYCALTYPGPPLCAEADRVRLAVLVTVAGSLSFLAIAVLAVARRRSGTRLLLGGSALAALIPALLAIAAIVALPPA